MPEKLSVLGRNESLAKILKRTIYILCIDGRNIIMSISQNGSLKTFFFVLPISIYIRDQSITRQLIAIILLCDDWIYIYTSVGRARVCVNYTRNPIRILIGIQAKIPWTHQYNINRRGSYTIEKLPLLLPLVYYSDYRRSDQESLAIINWTFFFPRAAPSWNRSTVGDKILRARF